ncbi:FtsP/CotA-like multicopper oxidase with cupredoxin domain [Azospirillum agricola]|uniref:multicopper oxidase family protein n=1 Tax=Azospirillum agricola TaxID=1720247 RepID=UPI001AE4FAC6|nr:multicopper oxidase family protein [Azospirillum agricola]MBP2230873.1 FtsP/CotA-like multicopper oxidase with cupredoxin domain [Azospirillum agricola]
MTHPFESRLSRRSLLWAGGAALAASAVGGGPGGAASIAAPRPATADGDLVEVELVARQRFQRILAEPAGPSPLITYAERFPGPVIRMRKGQRLRATLVNELEEHTSIHWHGIRLPNAEDGVPFLTQPATKPGERHVYEFTPPDSGSFFFHPHCNTVELLGRGLAGALIVEEEGGPEFDADLVCMIKDWILDKTGAFGAFTSDRGASRAGTFGGVSTVNGLIEPVIDVPANGDVRARFYNVDSSRVIDLKVEGADAWIIAVDGNPLPPRPLDGWPMGPAMRVDVVFRAPREAGRTIRLLNVYSAEPKPLAVFRAAGPSLPNKRFAPRALPAADIPKPDLRNAQVIPMAFSATAVAQVFDEALLTTLPYADSLCLSQKTFWAINQQSWPEGGHERLPPPITTLELGRSYVFELANLTPHLHPIHIHGYTFSVLSSDQRKVVPHHADTVLLEPKERLRVAIKADNPGDWMFHCHIIEHQDTGMMGYIRVA